VDGGWIISKIAEKPTNRRHYQHVVKLLVENITVTRKRSNA